MSPLPTRRALDEFDFDGRRRLLRLVVEKVRVTGWHVEIHLKITLQADPTRTRTSATQARSRTGKRYGPAFR